MRKFMAEGVWGGGGLTIRGSGKVSHSLVLELAGLAIAIERARLSALLNILQFRIKTVASANSGYPAKNSAA